MTEQEKLQEKIARLINPEAFAQYDTLGIAGFTPATKDAMDTALVALKAIKDSGLFIIEEDPDEVYEKTYHTGYDQGYDAGYDAGGDGGEAARDHYPYWR